MNSHLSSEKMLKLWCARPKHDFQKVLGTNEESCVSSRRFCGILRMSTSYHFCLDLRGALINWTDRQWRGVLHDDNGRVLSPREAKLALMDELAKGRKVIPCSPCDNFDYQKGCKGHPAVDRKNGMESEELDFAGGSDGIPQGGA